MTNILLSDTEAIAATLKNPDSFRILGKIKNEESFSSSELDTFPKTKLNDQIFYNQKGEIKDTLKNMKGVSLKSILASIEFIYEKPKDLNEFYFIFIGSDGYKVVFSWNEIFNTETGNHFFIVTERDGKKLLEMEQRIMFISTGDLKAGRRTIKGLDRIEVRQVD